MTAKKLVSAGSILAGWLADPDLIPGMHTDVDLTLVADPRAAVLARAMVNLKAQNADVSVSAVLDLIESWGVERKGMAKFLAVAIDHKPNARYSGPPSELDLALVD